MENMQSRLAGYLLVCMVCFSVLHHLVPAFPLIMSGLSAWAALFFLWGKLAKQPLIQSFVLSLTGLICILWARERGIGTETDISLILGKNHLLLSLLVGVSFLRLVTLPEADAIERLPKGRGAFIRTLFGAHIFSAVINLSAIMIVAERLKFGKKPDQALAVLLTRAFGSAAFWSPFFAAMATALTYSPGASLINIMIMGLPLSLAGLLISIYSLNQKENKLENFTGYPMHFSSLWIPALLAFSVFLTNYYFPHISILVVITFFSILITIMIMLMTRPKKLASILHHHIVTALPGMVNELGLFLSAGILAVGVSSLLSSYNYVPEFANTGFLLMFSLLITTVVFALIGIHPVISIAIIGTGLASLKLDPDLLALVFVFAWGLGITVSPLSGLNLALQGRFGIPGLTMMKWNASYTLKMLLLAGLLLWFYSG